MGRFVVFRKTRRSELVLLRRRFDRKEEGCESHALNCETIFVRM